jgi:amino acid adenylation domain-containing protein
MSTISSRVADLSPEQLARLAYELKANQAKKKQEMPKRVPGDHCPLSFAQQRLWFIAQLQPDDPSYNCMEALRMTGKLNVPLLHQSFNEVVRRHEALRTRFSLENGEPVQIISSEIKLNPSLVDLRALPASERERQVSTLSSEELRRPFDLTWGPLLRVVVLQIGEQEHAILLTTHHIISDGWSQDVLVREIIELYLAFAEGRPSPLAELPFQYADFAIWQRQRLTGPVFEGHLEYWRQHLEGAPYVLALPTDHPRPAVLTHRGSYESLTFSAELSQALRALGRRKQVTLFMMMLAAFDVLLSRYSGQTDFLIGTDVANRDHSTSESLIGFFVNQLVLRVDLAGDPTFSELLDRVKEVTLNGYAHQETPFEKLVEMLNPERNLNRAPLFQVKLVLQNASTDNLELPELAIGGVEAENPIAKFDLTLVIGEADRISVEMDYSTDLFESSTISRMLTQFERLLAAAATNPEQHISQLELLSSAERQQLLVDRNDTRVPYPRARCIHELFEEQVAKSPNAVALTFAGQQLSYAELNTRANQLAHYLRQFGITGDVPVGVCLDRSSDLIVALVAILKAGGTYVPLDPTYPTERLAFMLEEVSPPIILTQSSLVDELPASWAQAVCLDAENELWAGLPQTNLADAGISSDHLAYVMFTSGSTGKPKGVAVPHRAVVRLVKNNNYISFDPGEIFLQLAPVSFDASTLEIWGPLLNGGRLVLMPPRTPTLEELAAVLISEGVTTLWLTAGLFHLMVEQKTTALAGVRQVVAGGDVLSAEHIRRLLQAKAGHGYVVNGYGPTESTTFACCHRMSVADGLDHGVPIGTPINNTQVYILGDHMELIGDGMPGELYLGGDGLARCYLNEPELTAAKFVPHPFSTTGGERLYRTGDQVRWRADGTIEFIGRVDSQIKIRGFRVEPGEIETVLARHGSIAKCAVVTRREPDGDKRLVAYVVAEDGEESLSTSALKEYLRERLPEFMIPSAIIAIESLPLNPNGKVDRAELATRQVQVASTEGTYTPPRTITEEILCGVWAEVLRVERVGIHDKFFDLGGDSILTIQVIVKARALGVDLSVQQIFQHQTVYELARELQLSNNGHANVEVVEPFSLISEADRSRLPADVIDAYPLTALQAGMLFHGELDRDAAQYHNIFSFHLRMPFDGEALQATLQQLIDLHPVLRTSFNLKDFSEPLQLVHENVAVPLRIGDLRSLSQTEQEKFLAEWMAAEKQHRFDWDTAPLIRFQIDRRDEESFQFSFSYHHALLDGWSFATMLTELFNVYSVMLREGRVSAAPVRASFRDFVAAERAIVNSEEARHFWMTMLGDATPSRLPRLGQSTGPSRGAGHHVEISPELSSELKELARTAGVPLKSVLLAAHLRVLSLLTGSDDVLTGFAPHGRPETEDGERALGVFLNTLPFRRRLAGGTWLQLVQETFAAERELLPFRQYPLAQMQQDTGNNTPLFEVIFNFVHFHVFEELENVSGLEVLSFEDVAETNFTLSVDFSLELAGSQIGLELHYDAAELGEQQIEALGRDYLTILENMTRRPLDRYEPVQIRGVRVEPGEIEATRQQETEYEAPRTPAEELLAGLWASVLRLDRVAINDDFIELGGHSLLALRLIVRIRAAFGLELPLADLFEYPTVAKLAQRIESQLQAGAKSAELPLCPAARDVALPLSFAQQRLWFLEQLTPGTSTYNMPEVLRLGGPLDLAALEQSISEVVRRHEAVRTTFDALDGEPIQIIDPFHHFSLPVVELSLLAQPDREATMVRLAAEEARRPFDLQHGPLLRAMLLSLAREDYVLLFTMHHIVSDGMSREVLIREITTLYEVFSQGSSSPLPELAIQYADFARWQREWLSGARLEEQVGYWKEQLADAPILVLPTDKPRPPVQTFEGASLGGMLDADLCAALKEFSREQDATLFMTLLASFHTLLHRYAQQDTILTGTPVANRTHVETEPLIGFFVNTLALRSDFHDDPSFATLLARLRQHALGAYAHQDLPFELLVDELHLPRDLSHNPLFQVMFALEEAAWSELQLPGLSVQTVAVENDISQFDLTLQMGETAGGELRYLMQYNTSLFEAASIRRMLDHFEELLRSVVRNPEQRVSRLALLNSREGQQLLCELNETAVDYEPATLGELFERQAAHNAAAIAVVSGDETVTYGELNERSNRVARHLRELGVGAEARVGLLADRGFEMVVGLLGIVKAGAAYVPLDPGYPRARLEYMIADAAVSVLLTERRQQPLATEVASDVGTLLYLDDPWAETGSGANLNEIVDPENLAYVIYTSGSTGQPKGVMNTHRGICNRLFWMQDAYQLTPDDRVLQKTPFSFDVSVWEFFWPLLTGARLVMAEPGGHRNPTYLRRIIEQEQITVMHFVPPMLQVFLEEPDLERCTSLGKVFCSGEALGFESQQRFFERLGAALYNLYGPTEAAVDVTHWTCKQNNSRKVVPIGRPIANTQIYLLDRNYEPVPIGVAGELYIGGVNVARGYHAKPDMTAEKFVCNPFSQEPGARLYKTGDLARYLPDGNIEFLGRMDQQVKLRGFRIELGEIEAALNQHASVQEAVVGMQECAPGEQWIVAYVQLLKAAKTNISDLRAYLKERLPEYMVPASFIEVTEFALTPTGKIDRRALPAAQSSAAESEYEAPRTPAEELLSNLWTSVLRIDRAGVNDNFFELGGHSLLAIQLVSRIRETFARHVAVRDLFENPTPAAFADVIEKALRDTRPVPRLAPVARDTDLPLSFAQRRLWLQDQVDAAGNLYNIPGGLQFSGPLNIPALEQTLAEIIRRHEALRTGFVMRNGQPRQVIAEAGPVSLPVIDLVSVDESDRMAVVQKLANEEARRPFDLARGQLLRFFLIRLTEEEHVGLFTMHHIVSDAWSMTVLENELTTLYSAFSRGEASPLPPLKIQYPDYAVWQQTYLTADTLTEKLNYWKQQLTGAPALLNLPVDRPRSPVLSYRGGQERLALSAQITEGLNELCRRENVTQFMTLLASFQLLLSWYSGQDDIVVGAPIAGRDHVETEPLVGFFVNTLVLRTKLDSNSDLREILGRVRETTLGAYAHQDVPFEMLVETLTPQRSAAHTPLFQVVIGLQNLPLTSHTDRDLTFTEFVRPVETTHYDLELTIIQNAEGVLATLTYNADLFEVTTIRRMLTLWQGLLEYLFAHSDRTVKAIFDHLDELDRQQRLSAAVEFRENTRQQLKNVKRRVLTQAR